MGDLWQSLYAEDRETKYLSLSDLFDATKRVPFLTSVVVAVLRVPVRIRVRAFLHHLIMYLPKITYRVTTLLYSLL